jgi:hypothetical protein
MGYQFWGRQGGKNPASSPNIGMKTEWIFVPLEWVQTFYFQMLRYVGNCRQKIEGGVALQGGSRGSDNSHGHSIGLDLYERAIVTGHWSLQDL